jgi:ferric-dicitrate binding protein FerR (iron transport regulator)
VHSEIRALVPRTMPATVSLWRRGWALGLGAAALGAAAAVASSLAPRMGTLHIDVPGRAERRADVFVDGARRCTALPCVVDVPAGRRGVRLVLPGTAGSHHDVAVEKGGETWLSIVPDAAGK